MRKEHGGLGFRHFHTFNLAMLGKQGWEILTNPDAIISRVFKAKYFPRGDFLGASIGHNPSFVWRSICASRAIVNGGLRWKIGDGSNVRIWDDPWIRGNQPAYVTSGMHLSPSLHYVSDLVDGSTNWWKDDLITTAFSDNDAREFLRMPRFAASGNDSMVWQFSKNGLYSVKFGYYYAMKNLMNNAHLRVNGNWSAIWSLKVPNKMRIFLWRIVRGCLPTRDRLVGKKVNCSPLCPMCSDVFENECHVFLGCSKARQVWVQAGLSGYIDDLYEQVEGAVDLIFHLLEALDNNLKVDFVAVLWCLWKRRNDMVWNSNERPVNIALHEARLVISDWSLYRISSHHQLRGSEQPVVNQAQQRWQPLGAGRYKCNVDGAWFEGSLRCGFGICIRDHHGNFISTLAFSNCDNLIFLFSLVELPSLEALAAHSCGSLESLPLHIFPKLQTLAIADCKLLKSMLNKQPPIQMLRIKHLLLGDFPGVLTLPQWILGCAKTLETLDIDNFPNLNILPRCLTTLTNLRSLYIRGCPQLLSLPTDIHRLNALELLAKGACPELCRKYHWQFGEYWSMISHIKHVFIKEPSGEENDAMEFQGGR